MQTTDARTAYHAVRRALPSVTRSKSGNTWRNHHSPSTARKTAGLAVAALVGRKTLPRGVKPLCDKLAAAVLESRRQERSRGLRVRLIDYRAGLYLAEASRRGLPTSLDLAKNGEAALELVSEARTAEGCPVALLRAEGWADYGARAGRYHRSLALLAGRDDAGLWAVRVPATITSAAAALDWLEPAEVRHARAAGRTVLRQGDVYVVQMLRGDVDPSDLPEGHRWDAETRTLYHGGHTSLRVPFRAKVIRQSTIAASGVGRRRGD